MATKKKDKPIRLAADPCVSVAGLITTFETWLTMNLNKDIHGLISPPDGQPFTWKTSPNHKWLCKTAPLYCLLAQQIPNTVVTSKKLLAVLKDLKKMTKSSTVQNWTMTCGLIGSTRP